VKKAEKLLLAWRQHCPTHVSREEFDAVASHYLGRWLRERAKPGSHILIIEHPALAFHPAFRGNATLSISLASGRRVKGIWVNHLIKAIDLIAELERLEAEGRLGQ
jgi:hypothetical protein